MKFVTQKVSCGRKLKIEDFEKSEKSVLGPDMDVSKTNMTFKHILDHSGVIPAQLPYIKI